MFLKRVVLPMLAAGQNNLQLRKCKEGKREVFNEKQTNLSGLRYRKKKLSV